MSEYKRAAYMRQRNIDNDDDDDALHYTNKDEEELRRARDCSCFCLSLAPGRRVPLLVIMVLLDTITVASTSWTIADLISSVPGQLVGNEPMWFWIVVGFSTLPLIGFIWTTVLRMRHHFLLYRQKLRDAERKMALWSFRICALALFHSISIAWMVLAWLALQAAGNAAIIGGQPFDPTMGLQWRFVSAPHAIVFCVCAMFSTGFNMILATCSMYRTAIYIDSLLKYIVASSSSSMPTAGSAPIPLVVRTSDTPSPRDEIRAYAVPPVATNGSVSRQNTLARLHASAQPFVKEISAYNQATVLVGTDDDENASPREPPSDDKLEVSDLTASDGEVEYERVRRMKGRPTKKKELSRSKTLRKEDRKTSRSDSAVRSSLDDTRPGYGGIDGMYKGGKDENKNH